MLVLLVAVFGLKGRREARILFAGDLFFDRYIRQVALAKGEDYIFSCAGDFLKKADFVVGNLEGPITENPSVSLNSKTESADNFVFTFPIWTAKLLQKNNFGAVNLGNNHIGNFGLKGIASTRKFLEEAKVAYFGGISGDEPIYRANAGGIKISFVSYNEFGGESALKVSQNITEEVEAGRKVIVYAHWGDEYSLVLERVKTAAMLLAKSGASLIIGSHPHIILPSETIGNTIVYYSLGNFIFDQYWDKEVSTGLVVELRIKSGKIQTTEYKVSMNKDGRTCFDAS